MVVEKKFKLRIINKVIMQAQEYYIFGMVAGSASYKQSKTV